MSAPWEMTVEEQDPDESVESHAEAADQTNAEQDGAEGEAEGTEVEKGGEEGDNASGAGSIDGSPGAGRLPYGTVRPATMQKEEREAQAAHLRLHGKRALANHEFDLACDILTDGIALCPESYKLYRLRSVAYACMHEYREALADAEMVIKINPRVSDGHYHKGYALYHMKKYSKAAEAFQDGLKLNPQDRTLRQGFWDAVTLLSQQSEETGEEDELLNGFKEQLMLQAPAAS